MKTPLRSPDTSVARSGADSATDTALTLWVVLARAHAAVAAHAAADVRLHDLTLAEFGILEVLFHKGPLLLGEVQRKILVSSGGITFLVDRLVERGLVRRQECPDDRRARYVALTKAGERLMAEIFPRHAAAVQRALSGLTRRQQQAAAALLRALGRAAEALPLPGADATNAADARDVGEKGAGRAGQRRPRARRSGP